MTKYKPMSFEADPTATYRALREQCPVHRYDDWNPPFYTLSRHADVQAAFRNIRVWSSRFGQDPWFKEEPGFRNDPPEHTVYRRVLNRVLSAQAVERRAPDIRVAAGRLVESLSPHSCDLLDDVTAVFPMDIFAPVLGISANARFALWDWTFDALATPETGDPGEIIPFEVQKAKPSWRAAYEYLAPRLADRRAERRRAPMSREGDLDLLTAMADARDEAGRHLPDDALVHGVLLVYFGAVHTTSTLLTNALVRLLDRRERWEALSEEPSLAATVIDESARLDAPVPGIFRTTTEAVSVRGVDIPSGAKVQAMLAAANRDPDVFDDPDSFRMDRDRFTLARQQLGFGFGVHLCVGAPLARLEGRILLEVLAQRLPGLRLRQPTRWWEQRAGVTFRGPTGLIPVTW